MKFVSMMVYWQRTEWLGPIQTQPNCVVLSPGGGMCKKGFQGRGRGAEPVAGVVLTLERLEVRGWSSHTLLHTRHVEGQ